MDTKSKRSHRYIYTCTYLLIFTLIISCFAISISLSHSLMSSYSGEIINNIIHQDYFKSNQFREEMNQYMSIFHNTIGPNESGRFTHDDISHQLYSVKEKFDGITYSYFNIVSNGPIYKKKIYREASGYYIIDIQEEDYSHKEIKEVFDSMPWIKSNIKRKSHFFYISFSKKFIDRKNAELNNHRRIILTYLGYILLLLSFAFVLSYLLLKRITLEGFFIRSIRKIYNDINILVTFLLLYRLSYISVNHSITLDKIDFYMNMELIIIGVLVSVLIFILLSHIKTKTLFNHTLIVRTYKLIKTQCCDIYNMAGLEKKCTLLIVAYTILIIITLPIFPITLYLIIRRVRREIRDFESISSEIENIINGNFDGNLEVASKGELKRLASDINKVKTSFNTAIQNEIKSERLKTELITNVSHDLRTPLTSIITFIDLLRHESDEVDRLRRIDTIEAKALQLKTLTDDLFDAAIATSGNMNIDIATIDIYALINQAMGELHQQIDDKSLVVVMEERPGVEIKGDGALLWRVVDNLLINISKYSLNNSRVYVDIDNTSDDFVKISFKNISQNRITVTGEELMQRFKRGDTARSTEGSGLGLYIVSTLMQLQGGSFEIVIDGDLFKSVLLLPKN